MMTAVILIVVSVLIATVFFVHCCDKSSQAIHG